MKKLVLFFYTLFILCVNISCDNKFEEINISPNQAEITDPNLLLSASIINTQNNIYGVFVGGDMGLCWAQHWSKVQYNDEEKYTPRRQVMNGLWDQLYINVINEANDVSLIAEKEGNTNLQAAGLIIKANAFQILTDVYGPIPFTEAINVKITQPKYDPQEKVYEGIIGLLDKAEALLANGKGIITPTADLLFAGNTSRWRKFGNSLKLKALMRISNKKDVAAEISSLVSKGNLISSNAESAQLTYVMAQPDANPIYETVVFGTRTEYKVSSVLIDKLTTLADPRLSKFAKVNNAGLYVGNTPGLENSSNYLGFSSPGDFYLRPTLPGVFISYSQVELLLAEATLKGYLPGGLTAAKERYIKGITANLQFNEVTNPEISTYTANTVLDFTNVNDGLEKIGLQTWLSLYGQGIEAWTEWRRTGFPKLLPVQNAAPNVQVIPRRFYYSTDENSFNQANYSAAVKTLSDGDSMKSKVWWMN